MSTWRIIEFGGNTPQILVNQVKHPLPDFRLHTPKRFRNPACNTGHRVGVITEIHGLENGVGEILDEINALEQAILSALN
jgi:hypothetical protein